MYIFSFIYTISQNTIVREPHTCKRSTLLPEIPLVAGVRNGPNSAYWLEELPGNSGLLN